MKIAYCLPQLFEAGGVERIVLLKAKLLSEKGYEMHIITAEQLGRPFFFNIPPSIQIHDIGINFSSTLSLTPLQRLWKRHKLIKKYKRSLNELLQRLKCDIVISTFSHEVNILPSLNDGSIKIVEAHFPIYHKRLMADTFQFPIATKLMYYAKDWVERHIIVPKYKRLIVLTTTDANLWKKITDNVINIPNLLVFTNNHQQTNLTNKRVIAVGHFSKIKSFDTLIKIWMLVKKHDNEWELSIIGKGKEYSMMQNLIEKLNLQDSVKILPTTYQIRNEYLNSSICTLTSKYEGFPMVLLEAMQSGLPCIAFDCPNGPREIINNKKDGYLVKQDDLEEYAKRLLELMHNNKLRCSMGNAARTNIQRYSSDKVIKQWENLFNQLITENQNEKNRNCHNS